MSVLLNERLWFPDPRRAIRSGPLNGLLAIEGDLSEARLLLAYRSGIFPWSVQPITWWSPDPRGIIEMDRFHVSHSLAKTIRRGIFSVTTNRAFREVMEACAVPAPGRDQTWISREFIEAYTRLHDQGYAHSLECWHEGALAGGVYGVALGGFFAGESMFHRVADASKVALYHLVQHLRECRFALFDIQMVTPHTQRMGAISISRDAYLDRLQTALELPTSF